MSQIKQIFKDKTAFTSPEFQCPTGDQPHADLWVGVTGNGPVYIDVKGADGTWRTYPELTFTTTTAQVVTIKRGRFRVRIAAAVATTVEVSA